MDHVRVDRFGDQVKESSKKLKLKSEETTDTTKAKTRIYKRGIDPTITIMAVNLDIAKEILCGQY